MKNLIYFATAALVFAVLTASCASNKSRSNLNDSFKKCSNYELDKNVTDSVLKDKIELLIAKENVSENAFVEDMRSVFVYINNELKPSLDNECLAREVIEKSSLSEDSKYFFKNEVFIGEVYENTFYIESPGNLSEVTSKINILEIKILFHEATFNDESSTETLHKIRNGIIEYVRIYNELNRYVLWSSK